MSVNGGKSIGEEGGRGAAGRRKPGMRRRENDKGCELLEGRLT